jgi:site-specific recombinase XerD
LQRQPIRVQNAQSRYDRLAIDFGYRTAGNAPWKGSIIGRVACVAARKPRSLSNAVAAYVVWISDGRYAVSTVGSYRAELDRFQHFARRSGRRDPPIGAVDFDLVRAFQLDVEERRASPQGSRPLARATVTRRLIVVRGFLRFVWDQHWVREDLATTLILPRRAVPAPTALDRSELEHLIGSIGASTLQEKRDRAFILMLLSTGARLSDALRLDRDDLRHNELLLGENGGRQRTAVLTKRARSALEAYVSARKDSSPALFIGLQPARRGARTERLTPTGARYICAAVARKVQMPSFSPRQLRHTTGTLLQEQTGDSVLTAETLGLASLRSVAVYRTLAQARRRLARTTLEDEGL